jgi:hypothetical protein
VDKRKNTEKQQGTEKRVATAALFFGQLLSLSVAYGANFAGPTHLRDYYVYTPYAATVCINPGDVVVSDVTTATLLLERRHITVLVTRVNSTHSESA